MKIGIDIVENRRFENKLNQNFLNHFLTPNELEHYAQLLDEKAKLTFICGRWAAKEAVFKTLKIPAKNHGMRTIEVGYNDDHAPIIITPGLEHIEISISHETNYSVAIALNKRE